MSQGSVSTTCTQHPPDDPLPWGVGDGASAHMFLFYLRSPPPGIPTPGRAELWDLGTGTPMLEDVDEGGVRPWHLVKPSEEPEPPRPRRGSLRGGERERAKAIPEIYLTRLLSMKVQQGRGGGPWARTAVGVGTVECVQLCLAPLRPPSLPPHCRRTGHPAEVCGRPVPGDP